MNTSIIYGLVESVLSETGINYDYALLLFNSETYGGSGGEIAVASSNEEIVKAYNVGIINGSTIGLEPQGTATKEISILMLNRTYELFSD